MSHSQNYLLLLNVEFNTQCLINQGKQQAHKGRIRRRRRKKND